MHVAIEIIISSDILLTYTFLNIDQNLNWPTINLIMVFEKCSNEVGALNSKLTSIEGNSLILSSS